MTANHYSFGDSPIAQQRLEYLADAFDPSTRAWFDSLDIDHCQSAVDLGCGIGRTTTLLAEHFAPDFLVGLDNSESMLSRARSQSHTHALFIAHDVTQSPFPVPASELLYARFLLTHLSSPHRVLEVWSQALKPKGVLLLEETSDLRSDHPAFSRYYEIVAAMQAHYGQVQKIGREIDALVDTSIFLIKRSELRSVNLPGHVMARLHAMNIETWKNDRFIQANIDPREISELSGIFRGFSENEAAPPVVTEMRQIALAKRAMTH
jgi:ubiquinone/menaquinone biosynthesis C-methylase UbiE